MLMLQLLRGAKESNFVRQKLNVVTRVGRKGKEVFCLMIEFLFRKKTFFRLGYWEWLHSIGNVASATELYMYKWLNWSLVLCIC